MVPPTVAETPHRGLRLPFSILPMRGGESPQNKVIKGTEYLLFFSGLILGAAGKYLGITEWQPSSTTQSTSSETPLLSFWLSVTLNSHLDMRLL